MNNFYNALSLIIDFDIVPDCFVYNDSAFDICMSYLNEDKTDISDDVVFIVNHLSDFIYYVDYCTATKQFFVKFIF